ncbi:hypothetical protein EYZ11_001374 [Aspergillus tanneri]|uniref:Uncharacterized protein n=1 Tax=Aspergillus tanneri TaxID=1220188 RepID=A0A4S3JUR8_9EURO|nr:uncharacterized protein ATNIH1004_008565 [Aspergillus tanneri]KAA8644364.1 hypothetical protein ATNIH1004_008565 [Aspergillus tanneri]THC99123.1 hypothetical protein EYZ11_001374 [Aspergillus tanneri]
MAEYHDPVPPGQSRQPKPTSIYDIPYCPYWAQSQVQYAQNLLECSGEPIEYDHDDRDYWDNSFFFPEDCSWSPPKDWIVEQQVSYPHITLHSLSDTMIPGLPDIKMLDAEALSDLLEDNLSPPEITSILVFATNGAIFASASSLPLRQLRNLSATYGAAYTCYAKNVSSGNLTGVNPASHPSSYVTAQSVSLGDVGSIVFELEDLVAVVTQIADKVLLAAMGPSKIDPVGQGTSPTLNGTQGTTTTANGFRSGIDASATTEFLMSNPTTNCPSANQTSPHTGTPNTISRSHSGSNMEGDAHLETQYEIDRSSDLARLSSLNLSASPAILLALESKSAALGRFLSQKLEDLESPEDF